MSTPGVYLNWKQGSTILIGEVNMVFQENEAVDGISFPANSTTPISLMMSSSASDLHTTDTFRNTRLYLAGDPAEIAIVQTVWPPLGGGFYISFDGGKIYNQFNTTYGYGPDPNTWVLVPASCIGLTATNGILGPLDSASFVVQYIIPEQATQYQIYDIQLTADFDIA